MRLDFNVLWVDDQQNAVKSQRDRIDTLVRKEGFRLQTQFASSIDAAKGFLSNDIYGDHIDLILMDYDLGAGGRGDDGLVEVRNIFSYKDIIFYSSQASDLLEMVAKKKIQGVYCSTRDDLPDTVIGAFEALVKKVLDIDHSRGIVMGATSDIDQHVNDCLVNIFEKSDQTHRVAILAVVARHMKEKRSSFEQEASAIEAFQHVAELLTKHNVYTSNDRLRLLKNALEASGLHTANVEKLKDYLNNTVPRRNLLAHVKVRIEGFSRKLIGRDQKELTSEEMKSLRQELLVHQEHFEQLNIILNSQQ
ncbi:MAG: hypothetical protein Q8Q76_01120 [Methylotenera sp.]|nr:hypothetical protein [Methylotenera sp.]